MYLYNRIIIYYFSGTGNSQRIALWIKEFAVNKNIECSIINIANKNRDKAEIVNESTLIIFISPTHGFNYPPIMLDFILRFSKGGNNVVLMNTRAGMKLGNIATPGLTGIAFILSSFILKRKGYKIVGQIPFDMPSNWLSIHPALSNNAVKFLHEKNYYRTKKYCDRIFTGETAFPAYKDIIQDILISPIALAYYIIGRFVLAKSFYASNNCDNCGLCIKACPVGAIKAVDDRPFWMLNCESCMKCMSNCPKKAIDTAHLLFVIVIIICSFVGGYLITDLLSSYIQSGALRFILSNAFFFVLLCVFYKAQHFLLGYRCLAKIITVTSLTHYKFWGRYKSIKDSIWKS